MTGHVPKSHKDIKPKGFLQKALFINPARPALLGHCSGHTRINTGFFRHLRNGGLRTC